MRIYWIIFITKARTLAGGVETHVVLGEMNGLRGRALMLADANGIIKGEKSLRVQVLQSDILGTRHWKYIWPMRKSPPITPLGSTNQSDTFP